MSLIDEIGYLPLQSGGANLFFQLINARYESGAMILTGNRGFGEWAEIFGDPVVACCLRSRSRWHGVTIDRAAHCSVAGFGLISGYGAGRTNLTFASRCDVLFKIRRI